MHKPCSLLYFGLCSVLCHQLVDLADWLQDYQASLHRGGKGFQVYVDMLKCKPSKLQPERVLDIADVPIQYRKVHATKAFR